MQIKYLALLLLVGQTVAVISCMRYSRINAEDQRYLNSTAVVMSEVLKLFGSFVLATKEDDWNVKKTLKNESLRNWTELILVGIPGALYAIQNNLIFIAVTNLPGGVYQVMYQGKILTTAFMSWVVLRKVLSIKQTVAMVLLFVGVATIAAQEDGGKEPSGVKNVNMGIGILAVTVACFTSGGASVYFEKLLKSSSTSMWIRNIQLALYGIVAGGLFCLFNDGDRITEYGFFHNYTPLTWIVILLQGFGGLIVAMVLKYADNIMKCFANSFALVFNGMLSIYLIQDMEMSVGFAVGTGTVMVATYMYQIPDSFEGLMPEGWRTVQKATRDELELESQVVQIEIRDSHNAEL